MARACLPERNSIKARRCGDLLRGSHYTAALPYGGVQRFRQQERAAVENERPGRDDGVRIAALGVLQRLPHVLSVDDPGLQFIPETLVLESLPGGGAVRGMDRVRDGDVPEGLVAELVQPAEGAVLGPQPEAAMSVDPDGIGQEPARAGEIRHKLLVCRQIDVIRGALLDLAAQHSAGAEDEADAGAGGALEGLGEGPARQGRGRLRRRRGVFWAGRKLGQVAQEPPQDKLTVAH